MLLCFHSKMAIVDSLLTFQIAQEAIPYLLWTSKTFTLINSGIKKT